MVHAFTYQMTCLRNMIFCNVSQPAKSFEFQNGGMRLAALQGSNRIKEIKGNTNINRKVSILTYLRNNVHLSETSFTCQNCSWLQGQNVKSQDPLI